jgi:hypothetical protein
MLRSAKHRGEPASQRCLRVSKFRCWSFAPAPPARPLRLRSLLMLCLDNLTPQEETQGRGLSYPECQRLRRPLEGLDVPVPGRWHQEPAELPGLAPLSGCASHQADPEGVPSGGRLILCVVDRVRPSIRKMKDVNEEPK